MNTHDRIPQGRRVHFLFFRFFVIPFPLLFESHVLNGDWIPRQ